MPNLASITVVGHLGRDPETKQVKDYTVCNFSLAVNARKDEPAAWYNIQAWGKTGEACQKYLRKGAAVLVIGDLHVREYDRKDGTRAYSLDVRAGSVTFLTRGDEAADDAEPAPPADSKPLPPADDVPF